jgi:predicted DNA-binding transcriptional regulator AlpA
MCGAGKSRTSIWDMLNEVSVTKHVYWFPKKKKLQNN